MEIILIILTSAIMGAINVASFYFGFKEGKASHEKPNVEVTKDNASLLGELANLMNYTGDKHE